jgi:hypothetical protein
VEAHTARLTRGVRYEGAWWRLQRESGRPDFEKDQAPQSVSAVVVFVRRLDWVGVQSRRPAIADATCRESSSMPYMIPDFRL